MGTDPTIDLDERDAAEVIRTGLGPESEYGRWAVPVDEPAVASLRRQVLDHVEALGLKTGQERSAKRLITRTIFGWFNDVIANGRGATEGSGWRPHRCAVSGADQTLTWVYYPDADEIRLAAQLEGGANWALLQLNRSVLNGLEVQGSIDAEDVWQALIHALTTAPPYFPDFTETGILGRVSRSEPEPVELVDEARVRAVVDRALRSVEQHPGEETVIVIPDHMAETVPGMLADMLAEHQPRPLEIQRGPVNARYANGHRILVATPSKHGTGVMGIHPVAAITVGDLPARTHAELEACLKRNIAGSEIVSDQALIDG